MNKDNFLKLASAVYKVLEFFPESDPLKNRAKDKALAITESLISADRTHLLEDVDILLGYLWIGKSQGWLSSANYFIIDSEYEKIKKEILAIASDRSLPPVAVTDEPKEETVRVLRNTELKTPNFSLSGRQKKILEFLAKYEQAQVMDLQTILPDVTKRTIRRDLDQLLEAGKIVRLGDFNQISYKINESQIFIN